MCFYDVCSRFGLFLDRTKLHQNIRIFELFIGSALYNSLGSAHCEGGGECYIVILQERGLNASSGPENLPVDAHSHIKHSIRIFMAIAYVYMDAHKIQAPHHKGGGTVL